MRLGSKHSEETKQKISQNRKGKLIGEKNPWYGKKFSEEYRKKLSLAKLGKKRGPLTEEHKRKIGKSNKGKIRSKETKHKISLLKMGNNNNWKGDDVGNDGLHRWIRKRFPKPDLCQVCLKVPPYDLANVTGIYNREFKNWTYMCRKCHINYDNIPVKGWITKHAL